MSYLNQQLFSIFTPALVFTFTLTKKLGGVFSRMRVLGAGAWFLTVLFVGAISVTTVAFGALSSVAADDLVKVMKTPDSGIQPRMLTGSDGKVHLLYFKKRLNRPDAREGNLYYRQYDEQLGGFGVPVKVSSGAFPVQTVSISRASMAIDSEGRIHALWYLPKNAQYYYSRSNLERTQFETQREMVSEHTLGIDAGADIAAHGNQIAIFWGAGDLSREYERTVFTRLSSDFGESFGPELQLGNPDLGACGCCSLAGEFIDDDSLLVAYRSALAGVGRHMQLLTAEGLSKDISNAYYAQMQELQQWEASFCPLSTNDIATDSDDQLWLVFETQSRIVQLQFADGVVPTSVAEPFTETRQKNPAIAINASNQRLVVWAEAISHSRGGRLNMRFFDADVSAPEVVLSEPVNLEDFSFPAVTTLSDGSFLVLY
jgi:hypothetical protein